ncbi:hypothetical protein YQE_12958, partial [Dendroctonus ponderosae]
MTPHDLPPWIRLWLERLPPEKSHRNSSPFLKMQATRSQLTTDSGSNRDSVVSSDHQTNSLYGQPLPRWEYNNENTYYKPPSDVSDRVSERSDEWEDVTDNEERESGFIVVRERHKGKKPGWSQHFREQLSKTLKEGNTPVGPERVLFIAFSLQSVKERVLISGPFIEKLLLEDGSVKMA